MGNTGTGLFGKSSKSAADIAIDCKAGAPELPLRALAPCIVAGIPHAPGDVFCVTEQSQYDYLVEHGAAVPA